MTKRKTIKMRKPKMPFFTSLNFFKHTCTNVYKIETKDTRRTFKPIDKK